MPEVRLCVYCRQQPAEAKYAPFCSSRCRMADLGRWLSGEYRVPGPDVDDPSADVQATGADDQDEQHR